jgi:uncharacterized protein YciI
MNRIFIFIFLLFLNASVFAQSDNPKYDKALADSLGADDFGMKSYMFVILKTGPNKIDDKEKLDSIFRGHLKNIGRLADLGKLFVAGTFGKNDKSYRGLFILNVKTLDEANTLLSTDPAIKEKLLEPEIIPWYGSAALPLYLNSQDKVEKKKILD